MKRKLLPGAGLLKPLLSTPKVILLCLLLLCLKLSVLAGAHTPGHKYSNVNHKHKKALILNPTLSYKTPVTVIKGVAMPTLMPTSSGVSSQAYNTPVVIGQTGIHLPAGTAVDAKGNVYISSHERNFNTSIFKVPANGGPATQLGFGFTSPGPMVLDASGDVFVIDGQNIKEILEGNTNTITIGSTGNFSSPDELAVDGQGNIYVGDGQQDEPGIKEFTCVGGIYSGNYVMIGSGFNQPIGVALDAAGNVYVADYGNNAIKKIAVGNGPVTTVASLSGPGSIAMDNSGDLFVVGGGATYGSITKLPAGSYGTPVTTFGSDLEGPEFLSADASGDVYLVDESHDEVKEIPANNGAVITVAPGFYNTEQIAIDAAGNVFVADAYNGAVREVPVSGGNYPLTLAPGFNFSLPYGVAVDAAENVYVGDAGLGMIYKIPQGSNTPVAIGSGLNNVLAIALDEKGNLYACNGGADLYEIVAGGNTTKVVNTRFKNLASVAVDAAGNIYGYDQNTNDVYKLPPGGAGTPAMVATGITDGHCLTVDKTGNVYVGFNGNGNPSGIEEISAVNGTVTMVVTTAESPYGVAIDGAGTIYCTDVTSNQVDNDIVKITPAGGYYLNTALPPGLTFDNTTGTISGTPLALTAPANYTVTAYNSSGSTSATFNLKVIIPPTLVIKAKDETAVYDQPIPTLAVTYSGFINGDTPASLTTAPTVNTTAVDGSNAGAYPITPSGAVDPNYTISYEPGTLTVALSGNNNLSGIQLADPYAALTTTTGTGAVNYKASVSNATTTITETATSADPAATIKINNQPATAGSASATITLSVGDNLITTVVTAQNGSTKTYTITVTRAPSDNASLSSIQLENPYTPLTVSTGPGYKNYTASVTNATSSIKILAVTADPTASISFNGVTETSGTAFAATLLVGANTLTVVVKAADETTKNYIITVTRAKSSDANLAGIQLAHPYEALTVVTGPDDGDYTASVSATTAAIDAVAKTTDPTAMITINGTTVASGDDSPPITLAVGSTTITTIVTAQDGTTTKTYVITVNRPAALAHIAAAVNGFDPSLSVSNPVNSLQFNGDGILVHQGLSPNGDGINDFLQIDGITNYPDNKLQIMNREGLLVYEAKGYDNSTKVFDGHSNKNGQMQLPGTYFFSLDYIAKGVTQHKTGYIVLKY